VFGALNNDSLSFGVKKMSLGHIKNHIFGLIHRGPVVRANPRDK
jgi:hypothetical protein